jgi:hypothetical protein
VASAIAGPRSGALPNLFIIGAAKCGTTSLHLYLDLHPDIHMAREKEIKFFAKEAVWKKGVDWYRARFDAAAPVRGESTVLYSAYPRYTGVPARMHAVVPDARLIYLVRDPIARVVSEYTHRYADRRESRTIDDALGRLEGTDFVERSRYARQIEQFLPFYPADRIRVVDADALRADRLAVLRGIFAFLGVDPAFTSSDLDLVHHETRFKRRKGRLAVLLSQLGDSPPARVVPPDLRRRIGYVVYRPFTRPLAAPVLAPATRARLEEFFAPDAARLRELTGLRFPTWTV